MLGACPPTPLPPAGYRVWDEKVDGMPPSVAVALANQLAFHSNQPYGFMETVCVNGEPLIVRVDPHTWSHDAQGNLITGCFHGATVYRPTSKIPCAAGTPTPELATSRTVRVIEFVFLGSAIFTAAFTISKAYFDHKHSREAYEENMRQELRARMRA
jgi:hypothetical protein